METIERDIRLLKLKSQLWPKVIKPLNSEEQRLEAMDDRIDSYLKGQMSQEEEASFLADCKSDEELRRRATVTALLVKVLKKKKR